MKYRRLGKSGLKVSEISLGSWLTYGKVVEVEIARSCFRTAFEHGVNFFDTADIYATGEAEKMNGEILKEYKRSDYVLGTKVYFPMSNNINDRGLSRKHIIESCDKSLKRLQTDYIDIYQCHRFDTETELEEVISAMDTLINQGKVLYWGVSQWSAVQICDAVHLAKYNNKYKPQSNQPVYNMLNRSLEIDVMDLCEREGLGLVTYSPLAEGILTGKYSGGNVPTDSRASNQKLNTFIRKKLRSEVTDKVDKLLPIANELGITLAQLALAWCLRKSAISSVITGASKPEQVLDNVKASIVELEEDILEQIEVILDNAPKDQYENF